MESTPRDPIKIHEDGRATRNPRRHDQEQADVRDHDAGKCERGVCFTFLRRRRASSPSSDEVGGLFFDFESLEDVGPRRVRGICSTQAPVPPRGFTNEGRRPRRSEIRPALEVGFEDL